MKMKMKQENIVLRWIGSNISAKMKFRKLLSKLIMVNLQKQLVRNLIVLDGITVIQEIKSLIFKGPFQVKLEPKPKIAKFQLQLPIKDLQ